LEALEWEGRVMGERKKNFGGGAILQVTAETLVRVFRVSYTREKAPPF
jgi:hypothetical protein